MAPIPVFLGALVGDSNRSTDGCRTATEVRMKLAAHDAMVRDCCDSLYSHYLDSIVYAFRVREPIEVRVDGSLRRWLRRRKRHARYRRGRETVRPRHRGLR